VIARCHDSDVRIDLEIDGFSTCQDSARRARQRQKHQERQAAPAMKLGQQAASRPAQDENLSSQSVSEQSNRVSIP
jgi:hypothetical protein